MKNFFVTNLETFIIKYNKSLTKVELEKIRYGLISIYLLISKLLVIIILASFFNILKETILFMIVYGFIKMTSFGLHASKSWLCLLISITIFIILPLFTKNLIINQYLKISIGLITIFLLFKNSPADTLKRPIVNSKRRLILKLLTTFIAIIYVSLSIGLENIYLSNILLISLIIQAIGTFPLTYKLLKFPYHNYKNYMKGG
ncbi:MAG: accessory gene regulator B family protein [Bacilli bacterium]|nr:accessory gene regulator B family protein [Bacilli bacterium]MDD4808892.1 accessory gene regulator B family protein [Bacilli bacterium]